MGSKSGDDNSRGSRLAVEDLDFLQKNELRPFRLALEFNKVDLALKEMGIVSTVVVFGSSRILAADAADALLASAKDATAREAAEQQKKLSAWYEEARRFGRLVSERGGAMAPEGGLRHNVIATGGGPGIMEAANRGAFEAGAPNIGFNIVLPSEQRPNSYSTPELTFRFHYFAMRKMHFAMRANALAIFPGGFGTMDELFEILTLKQTRKTPSMPVILFCKDYWRRIVDFDALVRLGMIDPEELELFEFVDAAEDAWSVLEKHGLTAHTPLREP